MTTYYGTNGNDTITSSNANVNWTTFEMGDGDDSVSLPFAWRSLTFYGRGGNDKFDGGQSADWAYGGDGVDQLSGNGGDDWLFGEGGNDNLMGRDGSDWMFGGEGYDRLDGGNDADWLLGENGNDDLFGQGGNDSLFGGEGSDWLGGFSGNDMLFADAGNDTLFGGTGTDTMSSGSGNDTFDFNTWASSEAINGRADVILDWDGGYDRIDSPLAGTSANYREAATGYTTIGDARSFAQQSSTLKNADHVFLYNAKTDTGFLLSDLDNNNTFETGVVLQGAGAASDMGWSTIF